MRALGTYLFICVMLWAALSCSSGDNDDDSDSLPDDDTDDDVDDDMDDDTYPPIEGNAVMPADYDGDGDTELLMVTHSREATNVYLVEPGTFEREWIFTVGMDGVIETADFDGNGVWDLVVGFRNPSEDVIFHVYMNGDFDTAAFATQQMTHVSPWPFIIDERGDGYPDFLTGCGDCDGHPGFTLFRNELGTFAQGPNLESPESQLLLLALYSEIGDVHHRGADVTGGSERELVVFDRFVVDDRYYVRFDVFDLATGELVTTTEPIETDSYIGFTRAAAADYDADGRVECLLSLEQRYPEPGVRSQFLIYGFEEEIPIGEYVGEIHIGSGVGGENGSPIDVNLDGVFDPLLKWEFGDQEWSWITLDGTNEYHETRVFESDIGGKGKFARTRVRGGYSAYSLSGAEPEMAFVTESRMAGETLGRLTRVSMNDGTRSPELNTFPLGEHGLWQVQVADLCGDGIPDVVVLAAEVADPSYDDSSYNCTVHVFNGENLELVFSHFAGDFFNVPHLYTDIDLTGDRVPDLALAADEDDRWWLYPCTSSGCDEPVAIEWEDERLPFEFKGPFL